MENKTCTVYEIDENVPLGHLNEYVRRHFPNIKRGDAVYSDGIGDGERYTDYAYWDGEKLLKQCGVYNDGFRGNGPSLHFKTITEFPIGYFNGTCHFDDIIYLDYDTFAPQIRNYNFEEMKAKAIANDPYYEEDYEDIVITYEGKDYFIPIQNYDAAPIEEYIELIKYGGTTYVLLVNSENRIVDIDGEEVYDENDYYERFELDFDDGNSYYEDEDGYYSDDYS